MRLGYDIYDHPVIQGYGAVHDLRDAPAPRKGAKPKKAKRRRIGFHIPKPKS